MSIENKKARNDTNENSQQRKDIKEKGNMQEHKSEEERSGLKNIENKIRKGIDQFSNEKEKGKQIEQRSDKDRESNMKGKPDEKNNKLSDKMKNIGKEKNDEKGHEDNKGMEREEGKKFDWEEDFKKGQNEVRDSLKKGNKDLSLELEKAYQGILQNCLRQSEDEPHKMEKCWDEFSMKMKPVFKILQEKSMESGETLKKCFESKSNAKECVRDGIDFGQKALNDASSSLKEYLA